MRFVEFYKVVPGMVLATCIKTKDNKTLLRKGVTLTERHIKQLEKREMAGIYIDDEWSADIFVQKIIPDELQEKSVEALANLSIDEIEYCAHEIVSALMKAEDNIYDMEALKCYDQNTYQHSVNVSILAVEFGIGMGYNFSTLRSLALGALLHDIGKRDIPESIIKKNSALTKEERDIINLHPEKGYMLLKENEHISNSVKQIIYQHHENWNGTGYPRRLKENGIYELAMIVHICDVYDALVSKRSYKEEFSISKSIDILNEGRGTLFDNQKVNEFFKYVPIYHKGSEVRLSDGNVALVYENHKGNMLRPTLKLKNGKLLDLRYEAFQNLEIIS